MTALQFFGSLYLGLAFVIGLTNDWESTGRTLGEICFMVSPTYWIGRVLRLDNLPGRFLCLLRIHDPTPAHIRMFSGASVSYDYCSVCRRIL